MTNYDDWFNEFEELVINMQDPNASLNAQDYVAFYEAGLTPYQALETEYPWDNEI